MISLRFLAGIAVGAGAMYFADPDRGRSRRAVFADRQRARRRRATKSAEQRDKLAAGRAEGEAARARGAGHFHPVDDREVELHVHQLLAGLPVDTKDVTVEVYEGLARVRGQVASDDDRRRVLDEVGSSPGVRTVESLLHLPGEPAPNKADALAADDAWPPPS